MAAILIRTVIIYLLLLAVMRISGKRQIGELQISELATTFLLSDIASYPLTSAGIPLLSAVVPILTIIPLEIILSFLTTKWSFLKRLLDGKPSVIIKRGVMQKKEMAQMRLSVDDLLCELRLKNVACVDEVDYAILEQNGQISVFPKKESALSHAIVIDGVCNAAGLAEANKTRDWLDAVLQTQNIRDIRDIFLLSVTDSGKLTLIRQADVQKGGKA